MIIYGSIRRIRKISCSLKSKIRKNGNQFFQNRLLKATKTEYSKLLIEKKSLIKKNKKYKQRQQKQQQQQQQ